MAAVSTTWIGHGSYGCVYTKYKDGLAYKVGSRKRLDTEIDVCNYLIEFTKPHQRTNFVIPIWSDFKELRILRSHTGCKHPPRLEDGVVDDRFVVGCMPLKPTDLCQVLHQQYACSKRSANIVTQGLKNAIDVLHALDVVHCDLSPRNILLDAKHIEGKPVEIMKAYVADVGCARSTTTSDGDDEIRLNDETTTASVRPPELMKTQKEQATGKAWHPYTYKPARMLRAIDIWSFAVLCDMINQLAYTPGKEVRWLHGPHNKETLACYMKRALNATTLLPSAECRTAIKIIRRGLVWDPAERGVLRK